MSVKQHVLFISAAQSKQAEELCCELNALQKPPRRRTGARVRVCAGARLPLPNHRFKLLIVYLLTDSSISGQEANSG